MDAINSSIPEVPSICSVTSNALAANRPVSETHPYCQDDIRKDATTSAMLVDRTVVDVGSARVSVLVPTVVVCVRTVDVAGLADGHTVRSALKAITSITYT